MCTGKIHGGKNMAINGVEALNQGYSVKLKNRGKNSSGITFELKNIFAEMQKEGSIRDLDGKGFTKKDAANLYAELNKIHKQTNRATNYTKMKVGQKFTYTAAEMQAMAKAAGYEIVRNGKDNKNIQIEDEENLDNTPENDKSDREILEEKKQKTINNVKEHGGKVIRRNVDGLKKQDIAVYKLPDSKVKIRRALDENGELGASIVTTHKLGNNRYITLKDDENSINLGEMQLKKVKIDGSKEKELIVQGKTTDEIGTTKYYKFIPKVGHPDSDGKNNRLGEEVFKIKGKYVTTQPEVVQETEKPKKKGFFKRLFGKKDKSTKETSANYNFNQDYVATQKVIAQTMKQETPPTQAMGQIFGITEKKADKMLKKIGQYSQKHDISTPEGKQEVYKIAAKYGVEAGKIQAFLDAIS